MSEEVTCSHPFAYMIADMNADPPVASELILALTGGVNSSGILMTSVPDGVTDTVAVDELVHRK